MTSIQAIPLPHCVVPSLLLVPQAPKRPAEVVLALAADDEDVIVVEETVVEDAEVDENELEAMTDDEVVGGSEIGTQSNVYRDRFGEICEHPNRFCVIWAKYSQRLYNSLRSV